MKIYKYFLLIFIIFIACIIEGGERSFLILVSLRVCKKFFAIK